MGVYKNRDCACIGPFNLICNMTMFCLVEYDPSTRVKGVRGRWGPGVRDLLPYCRICDSFFYMHHDHVQKILTF